MPEDRARLAWQRRMASFMTASVIVAAAFFAIVTVWQYGRLQASLSRAPPAMEDPFVAASAAATGYDQRYQVATTRAALGLERELIGRRYDQANLTLTTRMWTRLMGFITGMILALVGAVFVLGKLSEDVSEAAAKSGVPGLEWSVSVRSASPGVILAALGTLLMGLSISIQASVDARDQAIYYGRVANDAYLPAVGAAIAPAAPPSKPLLARALKGPEKRTNSQEPKNPAGPQEDRK